MNLATWRNINGWSLARLGAALGNVTANPGRSMQRIERGEVKVDAHLIERIARVTGGAVSPQDMHETRLEWLRSKRPLGSSGTTGETI